LRLTRGVSQGVSQLGHMGSSPRLLDLTLKSSLEKASSLNSLPRCAAWRPRQLPRSPSLRRER
jgi:hypothetical protein